MEPNFSVPADEMLEDARTMHELFLDNKSDFTNEDPDFDDPFADDFLDSIEESEATETAETRQDAQEQETAEVMQAMGEARFVYEQTKYYVQKAFPKNLPLQHKFGLNNFTPDGQTQKGMAIFFANLHRQCEEPTQKLALLAVNMTQAKIDQIATVRNSFTKENQEQNAFIEATSEATAKRNAQYNDTYSYMQRVNRASKVIYFGNVIKLNQFRLPHGSTEDAYNVEGKVVDGSNGNKPLKGVTVGIKQLGVTVKTNYYGNYGFVGIPAGSYTLEFILQGYLNVDVPIVVTQSGKLVVNQTLTVE